MSNAETYAWILLSISDKARTREDIVIVADGINHAVPTDREMEKSLEWLQAAKLIRQDGSRFLLTDPGSALLRRLRTPGGSIMKTWNIVAKELASIINEDRS